MRTSAILFTGIEQVALDEVDIPMPGEGEVLLETRYSCISPGTELRTLRGKQAGQSSWPIIPGYATVGEVVGRGANVTVPDGTLVFCSGTHRASLPCLWGGHVGLAVVAQAQVFPIPQAVDPIEAALAKLAAIAYHGLRLSHPYPEETVAVVGLGPIGQLSARLHAATGARVVAADVSAQRVQQARASGIEAYVVRTNLTETFREALPHGAEVVVDATGAAAVLPEALDLARTLPWDGLRHVGARYLLQGSYADGVHVPYDAAFQREIQFLIPRDQTPHDLRAVLDLMQRNVLQARDLVSAVRGPTQAAKTYAELSDSNGGLATAVFEW